MQETDNKTWENSKGENMYPYKDDEKPIHHPTDYTSDEVNREVV